MLDMKKRTPYILVILCLSAVALPIYLHCFFRIYNSDAPDTIAVASEFAKLVDAWSQSDTNTVRALCVSSFDPYATNNYAQMNFQMEHQSTIRRIVLEHCSDGFVGFHPSAHRFITTIFNTPYYFLGKVYFYQQESGKWKFTGGTDYYVD